MIKETTDIEKADNPIKADSSKGYLQLVVMSHKENGIELYCGDSIELINQIPDKSIDLIFTDPPYPKEYLYLYDWLGSSAADKLKQNSFLFAYTGPYWKSEVMKRLGQKLDYYWDFILKHQGNTTILWPRKIISGYKSILCYQKGRCLPKTNVLGLFIGTGGDKRFHKWGQEESSARYYIDCFTNEGDLVFDPFLGGGTTAVVCKYLNRRFIGFEKDENTFKIAVERLKNQHKPKKYEQLKFNCCET